MGDNLLQQAKYSEAESPLRGCMTIRQKHAPEHWATFNSMSLVGASLLGQKNYGDAEPLLLAGCKGLQDLADAIPQQRQVSLTRAMERLVLLYEATDQKDKAAKWRKALQEHKGS